MNLLGTEIDGPIVAVRAVHFTATAVTAGALMFRAVVAEPALRSAGKVSAELDAQIRAIAWIGLAVSVVSGIIWLILEASAMGDQPWDEAVVSGTLTTGTINPGVIWVGTYFQVGIEALIPINRQSGSNVGVIAQLHLYLDDIDPRGIGKPIFGGPVQPASPFPRN